MLLRAWCLYLLTLLQVGGNYAPTIKIGHEAAQKGFTQVLWLFGDEKEVRMIGGMLPGRHVSTTLSGFFFWLPCTVPLLTLTHAHARFSLDFHS